ncbi:polysaccharide biosynthesis tyrosine autokinase [Actinoallomurus spadix]|uniref:Polysaccharide biosynthesis tyrosine autokinase n=1 Tax=Actinoallomurus spadix TaxID=79912 RepID=A0ABN0WZ62_9ACTN|nr:polysaccharide biosynthesis tyrosine autokinase [Actinoallomurus spadix]MCO5989122.1 polysaccharide biosynthesis tyrosine autokinase [Actinoallomurus spadix]
MSVRELITAIRRHLVLLVGFLLLGAGVAQLVTSLQPTTYESKASVFVSVSQQARGLDQAYQGTLFSQQQVRSYADLVTTPKVTAPVIRDLRLHLRPEKLAKRLKVDVPVDTVLLNITARDTDPAMAARIVNSVTHYLITAVADVEGPQPGRSPTVRVQVVRPGAVPKEPSSPKPVLNVSLGLVLGAIAGVLAGMLKEALDTRIDVASDAAAASGLPIVGEIAYERAARKRSLVYDTDPLGMRAEGFRKLRTNLRFINVDRPPRTIVVSSPLEGDGKSSVALNLAFCLAQDGARVVIVDADLRRPTVASSLGLVEEAGLTSVLSGQASVADVIQRAERGSTIKVLTSGPVPPNPSELLGTKRMQSLIQELRADADYVIIDSPPLIPVTDAAVIAPSSDGVVLVVRSGRTKREELRTAAKSVDAVNGSTLGVIVNMTKPKHDRYRYYGGYRRNENKPRLEDLGTAPSIENTPTAPVG